MLKGPKQCILQLGVSTDSNKMAKVWALLKYCQQFDIPSNKYFKDCEYFQRGMVEIILFNTILYSHFEM